jgi:hypothetical protein
LQCCLPLFTLCHLAVLPATVHIVSPCSAACHCSHCVTLQCCLLLFTLCHLAVLPATVHIVSSCSAACHCSHCITLQCCLLLFTLCHLAVLLATVHIVSPGPSKVFDSHFTDTHSIIPLSVQYHNVSLHLDVKQRAIPQLCLL